MLKGATPVISVFILGGAGKPKNISSLRDILRKNCTIALIGEQQFFSQCENPDFPLIVGIDCSGGNLFQDKK